MARNPIYGILWLAVLVFLAWPIAIFCAPIWAFLLAFEPFFRFLRDINDFLERLITWPRECGKAMRDCTSYCPTP